VGRWGSVVVVGGMAALATGAGAQDWPQWRGPARSGAAPALASRTAWPAALTPAWKATVGAGHAAPVVAGGRVYVFARQGEKETLQALDAATGAPAWQQSYAAPYEMNSAATSHGKGPKSTPVVAEGRVFTYGIGGILSAHDAATGRLLWRQDFASRFPATAPLYGSAQSPLVDGGRVIVHVGGPGRGALTAFDAATGAVAWAWTGDGPGYASPVIAEAAGVRQVVTFTEGRLVGLSADKGEELWSLPFTTDYSQNAVTPLVQGDLVVYSGLDQPLRAARIARAGGKWALVPVWENAEVATYMSSPVLAGGRVCGLSHRRKGQLFCVDAASGKTAWLSEGRQGENAALVAAGSTLLVLTTGGELIVADASAPAFAAVRRYTVATGPTWAHLAVTQAGVLVKDAETLAFLRF
jgi:outer membrane protein assembly factor BamB